MGKVKNKVKKTKWFTPKLKVTRFVGNKRIHSYVKLGPGQYTNTGATTSGSSANIVNTNLAAAMPEQLEYVPQLSLYDNQTKCNRYEFEKRQEVDDWSRCRESFYKAVRTLNVPTSQQCVVCKILTDNIVRCLDCGPQFYTCKECAVKEHQYRPLHDMKVWKDGWFQKFDVTRSFIKYCSCSYKIKNNVTVVNSHGLPFQICVDTCSCSSCAEVLIYNSTWPATAIDPTYAFSMDFLNLHDSMLLEAHMSAKGFISSFSAYNELDKKTTTQIYKRLMTECVEEFRQLRRSKLAFLQKLEKCPACPNSDGIVSMDANFGLVHKRSAGTSYENAKHPWDIFLPDNEVADYLQNHDVSTKDSSNDCNNFQAGTKIRDKIKNKKLDVTGIFACICRHEIPIVAFNITHGERLAYPCLAIETTLKKQKQVKVLYDIACVLEKYLHKFEGGTELLQNIKLAIPAFHVFGHQASCQVKYSPSRLEGFGQTDGEGTERLWSYLRPFGKISKQMTPVHRQDIIVDAMQHYSIKKKNQMVEYLVQRYKQAHDTYQATVKQSKELLERYQVCITDEMITKWQQEEHDALQKQSHNMTNPVYTWQEKYVSLLLQYNSCKADVLSTDDVEDYAVTNAVKKKELQSKVDKIEKQHNVLDSWKPIDTAFQEACESLKRKKAIHLKGKMLIHARERKFLVLLIRKYAEGQAVAIKLSKQIKAATTKIKKNLVIFKDLDHSISLEEVLNPESDFYKDNILKDDDFPPCLKAEVLNIKRRGDRALEEIVMLENEMKHLVADTVNNYDRMSKMINDVDTVEKAILFKEINNVLEYYKHCISNFKNVLSDLEIPTISHIAAMEIRCETDIYTCIDSESEDDNDDYDFDEILP